MSTLLIAAILLVVVFVICQLLISIDKKQKRKRMNLLLNHFSRLGSNNDLTFSSQELLEDCVLGLDGVHRKLLVLTGIDEGAFSNSVIDLDEVKNCSVKKIYRNIKVRDLENKKLEDFLQHMSLHFEFSNEKEPVEIPFYKYTNGGAYPLRELEQKAKHWETILSKMLRAPAKKIA